MDKHNELAEWFLEKLTADGDFAVESVIPNQFKVNIGAPGYEIFHVSITQVGGFAKNED